MDKIVENAELEEEKKSIWFEAKRPLHDIESEEKRLDKHQEILKKHLAQEEKLKEEEIDKAEDEIGKIQEALGGKRKKKWRIW